MSRWRRAGGSFPVGWFVLLWLFPVITRSGFVYFTDRGIEELEQRRGEEEVTFEWLAERLREFVDLNPEFEVPVERLATWLARLDDE